jgi:hypothetical protein
MTGCSEVSEHMMSTVFIICVQRLGSCRVTNWGETRPRDERTYVSHDRLTKTRLPRLPRTMADARVENFRPTGLLQIEESMGTDPEENFVPNGLLGGHLANQLPSSIPDNPPCNPPQLTTTTSSPFRQNGLLSSASAETGVFRCGTIIRRT